ncbi:MAG: xanthine dehydrogenase family protein molybdopterin-binding subunit [Burkholderiales bacterium]
MSGGRARHIGRSVPRLEDDRLLRGLGCFIDDLDVPAETLHLAFVLSPHAHARIVSIDAARARCAEGVVDVLTGHDFIDIVAPMVADSAQPGYQPVGRCVVAVDRVRFVGELVAVVVASDPYLAEDAVEMVEVDYDPLPEVADVDAALAAGAVRLHDGTNGNSLYKSAFKSEGFEQALAGSALVVRERFTSSRLAAIAIEPRGCLARYDRGHGSLTLWTSTQIPHIVRTALAELLRWDETRVRVVAPDVGGGFGVKASLYPEEVVTAALARRYGGCVKWIGDRREDLINSTHGRDFRYDLAMGFERDGTLVAVMADITGNIGAYPAFPFGSSAEASGAAIFLPGPYRLKHYAYVTCAATTNTCPTGVYRGVVAPVAFFATEALMDRAAAELGIDPAAIRLKNVLKPEDYPYVNAVGITYDSGSHETCLRRALDAIDYSGFRDRQPAQRLADGMYRGIGIACVTEHTGQGASRYRMRGLTRIPGYDGAHVKLEPNGRAVAWVSLATQGQGHLTAFAQIVAEQLGIEVEHVTVMEGDTGHGPYGTGTFASRGAVTGGGALIRAAETVARKMRRVAAELLEAAATDIELAHGHASIKGVEGMRVSIREVAAVAYALDARELPTGEDYGLEATDYYDPPKVSVTNATHIAQVAVDPVTGLLTVERYVVVHDCGRVINPMLVEGQLHGGIVQGLGSVMCEAVRYASDGQLMTTTLMDYLVPTAADVPEITVMHEETPSKDTAGGFKGVGEGGVIGAVPAIANAVRDALRPFNAAVNRLPLRPDEIMRMIGGTL